MKGNREAYISPWGQLAAQISVALLNNHKNIIIRIQLKCRTVKYVFNYTHHLLIASRMSRARRICSVPSILSHFWDGKMCMETEYYGFSMAMNFHRWAWCCPHMTFSLFKQDKTVTTIINNIRFNIYILHQNLIGLCHHLNKLWLDLSQQRVGS